jgi:predicted nuclease of predicted toxin-antitoxin system
VETSSSISDIEVLQKALTENRILVTMDKDFGDLVFRGAQAHCGVILLRTSSWNPEDIIALLSDVITQHNHELENNFIVATPQVIRIVRMAIVHH